VVLFCDIKFGSVIAKAAATVSARDWQKYSSQYHFLFSPRSPQRWGKRWDPEMSRVSHIKMHKYHLSQKMDLNHVSGEGSAKFCFE